MGSERPRIARLAAEEGEQDQNFSDSCRAGVELSLGVLGSFSGLSEQTVLNDVG